MPGFPNISQMTRDMSAPGFGSLGARIAEEMKQGNVYPLHLGDTYLLPPEVARTIDLNQTQIHRYISVTGIAELRSAVTAKFNDHFAIPASTDEVFITPGSTGGLSLVSEALFDPGDEVIILTPSWPLIFGILQRRGVVIREVDVGPDGVPACPEQFTQRLKAAINANTAAIYFCDPNNPAGFVYPEAFLSAIGELAAANDLWVISDIAYAELAFSNTCSWPKSKPHSMPAFANRLITAGTYSKIFALAGHRAGFLHVPKPANEVLARLLTHTTYHASTSAQEMVLRCLQHNEGETIRASYQRGAELTAQHLTAKFTPAEAGAFVFVDLRPLGIETHEQCLELLHRCLDAGVALCPGRVFGQNFAAFARLCYTTLPEADLIAALNILNPILTPPNH